MTNAATTPQPRRRTPNEIVASNIKGALAAIGANQDWLAGRLGISEMSLSRRLSSKNAATFSSNEVAEVADILRIPVGELFVERWKPVIVGQEVGPDGFEPTTSTVVTRKFNHLALVEQPVKAPNPVVSIHTRKANA